MSYNDGQARSAQLQLTAAAPEPSSLSLGCAAIAAGLLGKLRRRRSRGPRAEDVSQAPRSD